MAYIAFNKTKTQTATSGYIPFGKAVPEAKTGRFTFEYETKTPAEQKLKEMGFVPSVPEEEKPKVSPLSVVSKTLIPGLQPELGIKTISFLKDVGQSIARSFVSVGAFLAGETPGREKFKPAPEATYTPQNEIEKKIFGTDKPIGFKTIGEETLAIGGEDFKQKWGNYSIPIGMVIAGLDITPFGGGKKNVAKAIAETTDVPKIVKLLKSVVKGSDEEIEVLAKGLKMVNKEADVLKIIETAGTAKAIPKLAPQAQKAFPEALKAEKGIIPQELQPLAQEARKYRSAEEFVGINEIKPESKIVWQAQKGSQTIGNKQIIRKPTLDDFKNDILRLTRKGYYEGKTIGQQYQSMLKKQPNLVVSYIDTGKGWEISKIDDFQNIKQNVLYGMKNGWAKVVDDFDSPIAKSVRKTFDDEGTLTDFYTQAVKGVGEVSPTLPKVAPIKAIEGGVAREAGGGVVKVEDTIQKLIKAIDEAIPLNVEQKKLYSKELAQRTARVAAMGEKVGGEKGFYAQLGQLKGQLPKKTFEAIRGQFSQKEADLLFDSIEKAKTLLPLEKVSTKGGLMKLLEGAVPTKSELELLREVFPSELIDAILARRPIFDKIKDVLGEIINIPRTLMATFDLSAPFRQGVFMLGRPIRFAQAFKDMLKFAVSEKAYQGLIEGIKARPTYLKMKQGGLALTEIGGSITKREERFMSNLAEKIPGYGAIVRGSNRAYTGFLNKLRADVFDDILSKAKVIGKDTDDSLLKSIGDFVNAGTGRGKFGIFETGIIPKSMEKAAVVLNGAFFSPRLMASRLNLLNPYFYIHLDPLVRKEAIKTLFGTTGILGSIYGLWKLNGGEVGLDPRNADFGKIKIGNTRYDLLGGFQQYIRLAAQLITGQIISSTTGRTITLGEGYKPLTRKEILLRFFENKTSPIASFIIGLMTGQTATGEDVDLPTEVINRFIPMVVQDIYDLSQEKGAEGLLYGLPAIFGVGVQTYGKQELVSGESQLGEPTTQIRPVPELAEKIRELIMGQLPLGTSKSFSVEAYYDQMSNLSRDEAAEVFDRIAETNPELAKKLSDVVKEREKGITVQDKDLKAKGVASGDRALAIKEELDKLKTKEEKAALWDEYVKKGVITKEVARQLTKLLNQ